MGCWAREASREVTGRDGSVRWFNQKNSLGQYRKDAIQTRRTPMIIASLDTDQDRPQVSR